MGAGCVPQLLYSLAGYLDSKIYKGVSAPGFFTPASTTDTQLGVGVSLLAGQTSSQDPPGLRLAVGVGGISLFAK